MIYSGRCSSPLIIPGRCPSLQLLLSLGLTSRHLRNPWVSQAAVFKMLRRVEDRCLERMAKRVEQVKARQSAQLEFLGSEAIAAWDRSKKPGSKVRRKVGADGEETMTEATGRDGDPRFLTVAREILADERRLWGLSSDPEESKALDADTLRADIAEARRRKQAGGGTPG